MFQELSQPTSRRPPRVFAVAGRTAHLSEIGPMHARPQPDRACGPGDRPLTLPHKHVLGMHLADTPTILPAGGQNAIGQALGLLGDEWNLLIIRAALMGATHYVQFREQLPISHQVLTNRLRMLVHNGLLTKREIPGARARTEYSPTPRGRSLWPVLLSMWAWERDWVTGPREPMPVMLHRPCGLEFTPLLRCRGCAAPVSDADISLQVGPSGSWERCAPAAATRRRPVHEPGMYPETMSVFGNRWAAAVLLAGFLGTTRFGSFQLQLGAPSGSLTERLQTFVSIGVFTSASPVTGAGDLKLHKGEYFLTQKGRAFFPILAGVLNWAQRWFRAPDGPAIVMRHLGCGKPFVGELACDHCLAPVAAGVRWTRNPRQSPEATE